MEVAVPEEPQKKIFRARKTMKMSDRQQLETLHNTLTTTSSSSTSYSSRPQTPLVNGTHTEKDKTTSPSPSLKKSPEKARDEKTKEMKGKNESKDGEKNEDHIMEKKETSEHSSSPTTPFEKGDLKNAETEKVPSEEMAAMDMDDALMATPSIGDRSEEKREKSNKSYSSPLSASPSSGIECDPEVKEGFLCLSEEDEIQAEKDEKARSEEEKMNTNITKEVQKDDKGTSENIGDNSTPAGTKRSLSQEKDDDDKEIEEERDGKRARLDGEELEAQLELKITASAGSRHKLEKMVQQLVEERLRVLQLTVFDCSVKELKERVEKIDNATKQQNAMQHINTLQAKVARLAKKFGAANQASENSKRAQQAQSASAAQATNATYMTQATQQRNVKSTMDPKLSSPPTSSANSTAIPAQPKPLSTSTTPTSSALASPTPILQIISTTTSSTPSSTSLPGQSQTGTLLIKTGPNTGVMTSTPVTSGGQSVSIQPLLIQLPLAMANGQNGALVNAAGGVGLIPVSSLSTVSSINKAKTTTPATTFIIQKQAGTLTPSSSTLVTSSGPAMSLARAVYPGGTGTVSSPSTGISVTTARTPIQCAAVVGVSTAASSPGTTGPAATGSAAAAAGPPSASALASKTDNQASTSKTPQPGRPKGSVIDLTEDDDDVQVTGVQKATVSPLGTQRAQGPPPLVSPTPNAGVRTAQRSTVDSPSLSRPNSSSASLPPLPLAPSPPARLPPEASHTSPPQQPQLKLARVQSQNGIVLSWCVAETDRNCAAVDTYHLYAYHQDHQGTVASTGATSLWKKIGEVKALPLPMACTLTQFVSGSTYYFAVRAKDVYGRFGPFCEPQCTDVINPASS
ncbi:activating transcription factor 7-interacting protein 1-like [Xyrauchen texanus]|uniref:activating transcription factor 7-interacting protein 1-like n=1 Tax=Xyrauchen texanus TaxID=154827 RepID=UPI0022421123|nr:activating transcription factor 7-interacting protein 1-like [Xyrauchen texanus]XP_051983325.1 activating transcription factor 7-interacting protein 1-like [Xyrauchen texanus]XP_051983326.1 activating transcription factor 7-interacting protein 1-like [Xyrauchen texanus]XP_051983327.1 activating transcription factor 7-interacting protein 1-like [Xyrauchen texanus]XP_051983328.1 activating transcription factor 7-interacting protein 1-like [Xyrauchen texanus]XP_051983329.1 activating transcrip